MKELNKIKELNVDNNSKEDHINGNKDTIFVGEVRGDEAFKLIENMFINHVNTKFSKH